MIEAFIVAGTVFLVGGGFYYYGFWSGYSACAKQHLGRLAELEEQQATLHRVVIEAVATRRKEEP